MACSEGNIFCILCGIAVSAIYIKSYLSHRTEDGNNNDVISQQPDDILISIITRLSTKYAVRTSILSKRWRDLHKFVSSVNFRCIEVLRPHDFHIGSVAMLKVFSYLAQRSPFDHPYKIRSFDYPNKIRSFVFRCCMRKEFKDLLESCVIYLGRLGLEELVLQCVCTVNMSDFHFPFSCHLLSEMHSLKYLQLALCFVQPSLKIQRCNSLQTLWLTFATVRPGALECILSICLNLHTLKINGCDFPSKLCFCSPNLQLKSLQINGCPGVDEIEFYAPNLIMFEFRNSKMVNCIFNHVPQLQNIFLDIRDTDIVSYVRGKLAKDVPHLKSLTFATTIDFYDQERSRPMAFYTFRDLRQLDFSLCCTTIINLLSLAPFLQSCPLLHEFHLDANLLEYSGPQVEKQLVFHSELKKVEISRFGGTQNEIEFAIYILRSGVVLEQMHISRRSRTYLGFGGWIHGDETPWSAETHKMINKQLQGQALSQNAQVILQNASQYEAKSGRRGGDTHYGNMSAIFTNCRK